MPATKRNFILPSGIGISADNIYASNAANSTTIGTGSIISLGGAGIAKSISIGGYLQLFNGSNYTAFVSSASGNTVYTLPATTPATGTSVLQSTASGVMSWVPMTATGAASGFTTLNGLTAGIQYFATGTSGSGFNISSSGSTHTFNIPIAGSGSTGLISTQSQTIAGAKTFSSDLSVTSSTASTNSTTGALVVTGGVGIGDSLFVAGNISVNTGTNGLLFRKLVAGNYGAIYSTNLTPSATNYTMITDGASVNFNGTNGVYFNINNTNKIQVTTNNINIVPTADSTSTSTGALTVAGGVGIGGSLYVASATAISGVSINAGIITGGLTGTATTATNVNAVLASTNASHQLLFTPTSGTASGIAVSSNTTLVYNPSTDILSVSGAAITSNTNSTSSTTGALIATGGAAFGQSISVGGRLQLFNSSNYTAFVSSASGNTVYTLPAASPATGSSVLQSTSAGVMSWVAMTASGATTQNVVINSAGNANVFHPVLFTPSSSSAGSAVSSDVTITFNPSTEILNVSGLAITSGTASTNTTTGALVVRGGLGVTGQLSFAAASFGFTGITSNPTMSFIGNTSSSPITLTVLTDNSLSWEGTSGQLFSIDNNLTSGDIFSVSDISGLPIINASAGQTVSINEFGGYTRIGNGSISSTGASASAADGSLVVYGGLGITGDVSIGGRLQLFNGTRYAAFVSSSTGNTIYTLPATSPATGSSVLQSTSAGVMSWVSPSGLGVSVGGTIDGSVQYKSGSGLGGTRSFFFNNVSYGLRLGNFPGEEITTSNSAALLIEQSIGSFNGSTNGTLIAANANTGFAGDLINLQVNANTKFRVSASGAIGFSSGLTAGGDVSVISNTNSTSTTSGALQVSGGLGITGNANIGGTVRITNTTASTNSSTGALVVSGGSGIGGSLYVGSNLIFTGQMRGGTNTFTKNPGSGDINLDNGTADTPGVIYYWQNSRNFGTDVFFSGSGTTRYRITKELNETGGTELWSIDREGIVYRSAYAPGETINTAMYNYSDLNMASTTTINSTSYQTFATVTYTPKSSTSYLWIEFSCTYTVAGTSTDDFWSNIEVAGGEIVNANQVWTGQVGGGTRSGVMFPLAGRYTNSGTAGIAISVRSKKGTSDDTATIYGNTASGFMRIQEIGR